MQSKLKSYVIKLKVIEENIIFDMIPYLNKRFNTSLKTVD